VVCEIGLHYGDASRTVSTVAFNLAPTRPQFQAADAHSVGPKRSQGTMHSVCFPGQPGWMKSVFLHSAVDNAWFQSLQTSILFSLRPLPNSKQHQLVAGTMRTGRANGRSGYFVRPTMYIRKPKLVLQVCPGSRWTPLPARGPAHGKPGSAIALPHVCQGAEMNRKYKPVIPWMALDTLGILRGRSAVMFSGACLSWGVNGSNLARNGRIAVYRVQPVLLCAT
jgi:hypothetical protein